MQNHQTEAKKKKQFLEVCEKEVFPYLNEYEKERKKFRKEYYSRLLKICLQVIVGTVLLKILNNIF